MIKSLIRRLIGSPPPNPATPFGKRQSVPVSQHHIDPGLVDERALQVVQTLQDKGFEAYIVGGAVRDLLLGLRPKDFDVATNATPEQVKSLFRRAFIIGRRFRIVHVVYGRGREHEVIEVSTFRAYLDNAAAETVHGNERTAKGELSRMQHAVDASGRVLRDNVWGPQEEDAARRDFTVNALYYNPRTQEVIDYHKGFEDAGKRVLRMIGDPVVRYREDPVRMVRAIRFSAKLAALGFKLEARTATPIRKSLDLLAEVPQSRMFDEMLKLLQTGHALASIEQLKALGVAKGIYPLLDLVVERSDDPFVHAALQDTDRRVAEGKPVAPSFLLACMLWSDVRQGWQAHRAHQPPTPALQAAIDEVFDARIGDVSGRGKLASDMREIWMMQPRFDKRMGNSPMTLVMMARFRAGFDFMRLRTEIGEVEEALADWWQTFSLADDPQREDMLAQIRQTQRQRPRSPAIRENASGTEAGEEPDSAPKRRRRRRRKPSADGGGSDQDSPA
jgi:poly(A) polymerase